MANSSQRILPPILLPPSLFSLSDLPYLLFLLFLLSLQVQQHPTGQHPLATAASAEMSRTTGKQKSELQGCF
ncbi:hypothetical protein EJD97_010029 [Solanum chilense]|uniref:Uncharacterized protein n=1 Tax=Solanum chilense TaxID=4083 RepID=A0A6N2BJA5_SOLCI|nr:hypothetical protein EJD97_010029 [Solanum chilense]